MNDNVDYRSPAELFPAAKHRGGALRYLRFETLAEAVQYAVESLDTRALSGAFIEVEDDRYGAEEIRRLYESEAYPLSRREG